MRIVLAAAAAFAGSTFFTSCKSDAVTTRASFCDTVCIKDTMKFMLNDHKLKPWVTISPRNCEADTITWSYEFQGSQKQAVLNKLADRQVKVNPAALSCFIKDTSYCWLAFNDCATGRGFLFKMNFKGSVKAINSAFNKFDPKFAVAEGLAVHSDRGNLFVEDMTSGKTAQMTFGQRVEIDYDNVHQWVDSVNVSPAKMWAKVKIGDDWKVFEKNITLK